MPDDPLEILPERARDAVKGDAGHVLVVGGSARYTNTPAIVGTAALRAGTDLVTLAAPGRSADASATFALNLVSEPLDGDAFRPAHLDAVLELADRADVLAVGPGLGRRDRTRQAVRELLDATDLPAVVDADAIHAVADHHDLLKPGTVVTPHAREFETLTGTDPGADQEDRRAAVESAAADLGCTVLLKGAIDVISDGDRTATNGTGNPTMTRGGTGDALTGITAAIRAMGVDAFDAARAAAILNGAAGDEALAADGPGYLLEDLLRHLSTLLGP